MVPFTVPRSILRSMMLLRENISSVLSNSISISLRDSIFNTELLMIMKTMIRRKERRRRRLKRSLRRRKNQSSKPLKKAKMRKLRANLLMFSRMLVVVTSRLASRDLLWFTELSLVQLRECLLSCASILAENGPSGSPLDRLRLSLFLRNSLIMLNRLPIDLDWKDSKLIATDPTSPLIKRSEMPNWLNITTLLSLVKKKRRSVLLILEKEITRIDWVNSPLINSLTSSKDFCQRVLMLKPSLRRKLFMVLKSPSLVRTSSLSLMKNCSSRLSLKVRLLPERLILTFLKRSRTKKLIQSNTPTCSDGSTLSQRLPPSELFRLFIVI
mmetsp:Transcript_1993/g.1844  ORF Transcript_1993/g.1844 Transcript_1993/m.1844 type:complete len:326 (+) Transcript_1993:1705-2682(+)